MADLSKYLRKGKDRAPDVPPQRTAGQALLDLQVRARLVQFRAIRPTQDEAIRQDFRRYGSPLPRNWWE